jgi:peptide/nickel transport system ATP-binding protein
MPLLSVQNLKVRLPSGGDRPYAVRGVSFDLSPDEIVCVVGESGSGKSILAKTVMGLLPRKLSVESGTIEFEGRSLLELREGQRRALRGEQMSMIFQEPMSALNPLHTIGRQIDEVLRIHTRLKRREREAKVLQILEAVKLPDPQHIIKAFPHEISGGQRQRAMIAMALVLGPKFLVADEPTTALDVTTQAEILRLIREIQQAQKTGILFITHDFGVVAEVADRVAVMKHGELVELGRTEEVLKSPQHEYTRSLIEAVPSLHPRPVRAQKTESLLEVRELQKVFRSGGLLLGARTVHALKGVSLSLARGTTLGIVGESGSGKSTLARCIIRLLESDSGEIRYAEHNLVGLSNAELLPIRKRIQMVFQDPYGSLNPRLTVVRMIAQGPMLHGTSRAEAERRASELLELVGLDASAAHRYPHEFSGGQRQRIGIARALALEPEILVADEPVSALDVSVQAQVLRLLESIRERLHLSMIFVTHDLRVAAQVCDSIMVMQRGEVVEFGATTEVYSNPQHPYTQKLLEAIPGKMWDQAVPATQTP